MSNIKNDISSGVAMSIARFIYSIIVAFIFFISSIAFSQNKLSDSSSGINNQLSGDNYFYNTEGRSDPFKPFVTQKSASKPDPNEIVDENAQLTGMQLFEPGQLTLVGVISSSKEPIALVEDQTKKGYVLRLGNLIGKRGVVSSIDNHRLIITETAKTRSGQQLTTTTTMRMKKEGDE